MSDIASSATTDPAPGSTRAENKTEDMIPFATHSKLLGQRKADQLKNKELTDELSILKAEKQADADAKLVGDGKIQELLDAEKKRSQDLQESVDQNTKRNIRRAKEDAIKKELGPLKRPEYLNFADIDSIVIDESGQVDEVSLKSAVKGFTENYADLLHSEEGGLPDGAPGGGAGGLTRKKWLTLPSSEMIARESELID